MVRKNNPRQLVLRRDTATGLTLAGWDSDLPAGRFEHIELICETARHTLPDSDSEDYHAWQSALSHARQANDFVLEQEVLHNHSLGWYSVPFELAHDRHAMQADSFGNFAEAAMRLHYQLTRNRKQAWVIIQRGTIVHVRSRFPTKELDELTYQVWYHKQRFELDKMDGIVLEGTLIICASGLWFEAK